MDRYWLITWTTYGTRLAGDSRGFVSNVIDGPGPEVRLNIPGTPFAADIPALWYHVRNRMTGPPVSLNVEQAVALIAQYLETAGVRQWSLEAAAVMFNHTHLVVGVMGDPDPDSIRKAFMSWATRALKKLGPVPENGTWWTTNGSERKLPKERAVNDGVIYVARKQPNPLATFYSDAWDGVISSFDKHDSDLPSL